MTKKTSPSILFIEDDMIERMKFNRTVSKLDYENKIIEANNGEEALKILEGTDLLPQIILLDLNMPRISGIEFLKRLKDDDRLRYIPTIVLTTSNNQKDLLECYRIGIAGYILKPLKYDDYVDKIAKLLSYWEINQLITT
ncbi:response regulator [Roseivirga echinicomitans]|uniref:Transcriptional regulator n=1 Tax=Roseivirga echinicomitans TaxID=296218 RepID=A0A150XU25_9BACT|nr:response regulator [Roseivirga echinicomitans]KYG82268.1 transcriptional regulator [Roseivirga echinicomitans]